MARPQETGLDYLPLALDFMHDRKIKRLKRRCDASAPMVYVYLLCAIYKEGYYIKWDEDLAFDLADSMDLDESYVSDVIQGCFDVDLLSKKMFDEHRVLTSHGIQKQYEVIKQKSKSKCRVNEYSLLVNTEEHDINSEKPHDSSDIMPQSKVKKSKVNYSFSLSPSPSGEGAEEEKEKIVSFFTFQKNWASPCGEYEKLVAYNNRPEARKKWSQMSKREKESAVALWKQKDPKARFAPPVLYMWKKLYQILLDSGAPTQVRMAALDDGVSIGCDGGQLVLALPDALRGWIERDLDEFKPVIWPMVERMGCGSLKYRIIKPTNTQQLQL